MSRIPVVAAVVERDGKLLLGKRPERKRHGGLWEFPGGKIDPGEGPTEAARRELAEELGLRVVAVGERMLALPDEASTFVIEFYPVEVSGEPEPFEHDEVGWFAIEQMADMPLAPADATFVSWLSRRDGEDSA